MKSKFISYLRDSSQRQCRSSLGLEAQREAVSRYLNGGTWTLVAEIIEVESGKRNDWPQLENALRLCHVHRATLLVAKLDRLARNVAFVSALMESGVKFQAVDLPEANDLTAHIMVATAESGRRAISARIKAGLAAAKARGTKLGGLRWDITSVAAEGRQVATEVRQEKAANYRADILPLIQEKQKRGTVTHSAIAAALNADNTPAPRGGQWSPVQVKRILDAARGKSRIGSDQSLTWVQVN
jgi:DNA invertase Pin-like site-specific DNA recombinase